MSNNEKLTETRYPFHGFYRPFVAEMEEIEAERAREQAVRQQPQALPTTAELLNTLPTTSTDIERLPEPVTKTSPPGMMPAPVQDDAHLEVVASKVSNEEIQPTEEPAWVADLIGEEYKEWEPGLVAIEAMTGTGKTAFILGTLLKWCVDECHRTDGRRSNKILFLCNRVPLRDEILDALRKAGVPNAYIDGYDVVTLMVWDDDAQEYSMMKVSTYQRYEEFLSRNPVRAKYEIRLFRYIVCDEAQYFFTDAPFNKNTALSYNIIMKASQNATVIAMTATPENMFTAWMRKGLLAKNRYYYLPKKMSHIRKALIYSNDLEREKLLNQIPDGEKALVLINDYSQFGFFKSKQ